MSTSHCISSMEQHAQHSAQHSQPRRDARASSPSVADPHLRRVLWSVRSGYGSPSEDYLLSVKPLHKTVSGDEPEQVRSNPDPNPHLAPSCRPCAATPECALSQLS